MGKIIKKGEEVIVEMDIHEVFQQPHLVRIPARDMKLPGFVSFNHFLGDAIGLAAYKLMGEKAPHMVKQFKHMLVRGSGKVIVTFTISDVGNKPE